MYVRPGVSSQKLPTHRMADLHYGQNASKDSMPMHEPTRRYNRSANNSTGDAPVQMVKYDKLSERHEVCVYPIKPICVYLGLFVVVFEIFDTSIGNT